MTLAEAEKKFCISIDALKQYVSFGFIQAKQSENGVEDYREQDFELRIRQHRTAGIHEKQQLLDQLDFMIWNKKKQGGSL